MDLDAKELDRYNELFAEFSDLKGEDYFKALANRLAVSLRVESVWLAEYLSSEDRLLPLVFYSRSKYLRQPGYPAFGTPCGQTMDDRSMFFQDQGVLQEFPKAKTYLGTVKANAYLASPLQDTDGRIIGLVGLADSSPLVFDDHFKTVFKLFVGKAQTALRLHRRSEEIQTQEKQLKGLIDGIQDLLVNFDKDGKVIMTNAAARNHLQWKSGEAKPGIYHFLPTKDRNDVDRMIYQLDKSSDKESFLYFPEGFQVISALNEAFEVEGTLNRYELNGEWYYTMVLRSLDHKMKAEEELMSLLDRTQYLQHELEEVKLTSQLVGESESIKMLWQDIYMVAHTDATVLVHGETGTGKELVARQVHQISGRKSRPMVSVNCGAIPTNLIESELFGHVKGAFTGAVSDRKGRFELANGGTIFLDEIAELPLEMQVKLLRVIQEKEFEPVGSDKTIKVDVRIVAASHRNLSELTRKGEFRQDLYYRLNVFPIEVPALRERGDDILTLAESFIKKFEARMGKKTAPLSVVQKKALKRYAWPGNVRELQNILERAVIVTRDGNLDISKVLGNDSKEMLTDNLTVVQPDEDKILTREELLILEKNNIIKALRATGGKVSGSGGAAELLNMVPTTLSSRIRSLGIRKGIYEKS